LKTKKQQYVITLSDAASEFIVRFPNDGRQSKGINKDVNEITLYDILEYLRYLRYEKSYCIETVNGYRNAIKYFYEVVLGKLWIGKKIPRLRGYKPLPSVLSKEEVIKFIELMPKEV